jgi:hypothetical protein
MSLIMSAFASGFERASRVWLLAPIYLCSLLLGLLQTWPLALSGALDNPFLGQLAAGDTDALVNLFLARPSAGATAGLWTFGLVLLVPIYGLLYNFFAGGILAVYAGTASFWAGCRRMFWTFTGLGLLLVMIAIFVLVITAVIGVAAGPGAGVIVGLVLLQIANLLGEYARAQAVIRDRRNPFVLLGLTLRFCVRHMPGVLLFGLLGLLLHLGLAVLHSQVVAATGASPLAVLWQQLVAFAWLWIKFLRLAWALSLVQAWRAADQRSIDALTTSSSIS